MYAFKMYNTCEKKLQSASNKILLQIAVIFVI